MTKFPKEEFRTKIFQNGTCISTVLLLVFGIGLYGFKHQDAIYSQVKFNKPELSNMITIVSYALEYVLVYAPLTVILLWNMKGCVLIKDQTGNYMSISLDVYIYKGLDGTQLLLYK